LGQSGGYCPTSYPQGRGGVGGIGGAPGQRPAVQRGQWQARARPALVCPSGAETMSRPSI